MKKYSLLSFFLVSVCTITHAQKIQYCKGIVKTPGKGFVRLLAGVNGYHHLIRFLPESKPQIFLFNKELVLESIIELNTTIHENTEVKIIQFENVYWFYTHTMKTSIHQLLKIDGNGIITDHSDLFKNPADSLWNKTTSSFNLTKIGSNLFVIINKYFEQSKTAKFLFIKIEPGKSTSFQNEISIAFDIENEELKDIVLFKDKLFVLKTGKDSKGNNILSVLKSDSTNNKSYTNQFESGKYLFLNPSFRFGKTDSSVFIYAMIAPPYGFKGDKPSLFMARLNESLNEIVPVKILKDALPETALSSFIIEKENSAGWMCFSQSQKEYSNYSSGYFTSPTSLSTSYNSANAAPYNFNLPTAIAGQSNPKEISFTVLNDRLEKVTDSLIKNNGKSLKIDPLAYASFVLNDQPYLILKQNLTRKSKALILLTPNESNALQTIQIRSFDRYEYLLSLMQTVTGNAFIVPFTNKKEMGLMKVTLTN
ncbi:hypothetical protein IQ13_0804 [Lacibacter cauensis]|uniref:Uncharacterized protein n=1 Tax=Lacibacter cauensis TaxID=510947 RepID=A0A562SWL3_9BACT|nr:hypothetical protein [Lacibacter cauensis]TWI85641.1 hypothetical protein IQ13_0804 [Lacibacter cauensis]